jgi:hypothetical protein
MVRTPIDIEKKYLGKLWPGVAAELRETLAGYRRFARDGVQIQVKISPPDPGQCPAADAQRDVVYSLDSIPKLPLPGCSRSPCACNYSATFKDEKRQR